MKKVIALVVVGGVGYLGYVGFKLLESADMVVAFKSVDSKSKEKDFSLKTTRSIYAVRSVTVNPLIFRLFPYSGFCEITGCTYEIHASKAEVFEKAMSKHLAKH